MDTTPFAHRLHALANSPSRRGALRLLAGAGVGGLISSGFAPTAARKKHKKKKRRGGKSPRGSAPASPPPPSPPPSLDLAYECAGPALGLFGAPWGNDRLAQRFVAGRSGVLRQVRFDVFKDASSPGDWVVQIVKAVGIGITRPSNSPLDVLAANTIADSSVPDGESTLSVSFAGPRLVKDTEYAAVLSRPGSTIWGARVHGVDTCGGQDFAALGGDAFISGGTDLVLSVWVD